jgi:hypothetical protein
MLFVHSDDTQGDRKSTGSSTAVHGGIGGDQTLRRRRTTGQAERRYRDQFQPAIRCSGLLAPDTPTKIADLTSIDLTVIGPRPRSIGPSDAHRGRRIARRRSGIAHDEVISSGTE